MDPQKWRSKGKEGFQMKGRKLLASVDDWLHGIEWLHDLFSRTWVANTYHKLRDRINGQHFVRR